MGEFLSLQGIASLLTLTVLEIVLGIDNIIFISILTGKLPREKQGKARTIGLSLALIFRIALLFVLSWIMGLSDVLAEYQGFEISGKDIILFAGGLFLLFKSVAEVIETFHIQEEEEEETSVETKTLSVPSAIVQIIFLDIVFSFDSILTAVGLSKILPIMIAAVIIAVCIMLVFSGSISDYINRQPTIRMLALVFLVMIGVLLLLESAHIEVPKAYVYVAMGFSLLVETLNLQLKRVHEKAAMKRSGNA
jgi:predicted tellurium resistance membrane protein TerC